MPARRHFRPTRPDPTSDIPIHGLPVLYRLTPAPSWLLRCASLAVVTSPRLISLENISTIHPTLRHPRIHPTPCVLGIPGGISFAHVSPRGSFPLCQRLRADVAPHLPYLSRAAFPTTSTSVSPSPPVSTYSHAFLPRSLPRCIFPYVLTLPDDLVVPVSGCCVLLSSCPPAAPPTAAVCTTRRHRR